MDCSNGTKRFLTGGRKKAAFIIWVILKTDSPLSLRRAMLQGPVLYMATQKATVIAFDARNLEPVIDELKKTYPKSPLVIAGA